MGAATVGDSGRRVGCTVSAGWLSCPASDAAEVGTDAAEVGTDAAEVGTDAAEVGTDGVAGVLEAGTLALAGLACDGVLAAAGDPSMGVPWSGGAAACVDAGVGADALAKGEGMGGMVEKVRRKPKAGRGLGAGGAACGAGWRQLGGASGAGVGGTSIGGLSRVAALSMATRGAVAGWGGSADG